MRKKIGSPRSRRHRITVLQILEQASTRLRDAGELANWRAKEADVSASRIIAPVLKDADLWEELTVELITADDLARDLRKDRTIISRRLAQRGILPIFYLGKLPLYLPTVARKIDRPGRHPTPRKPFLD